MHAISDSIYFQVHRTPHQDVSSSGFEANTIKSLKKNERKLFAKEVNGAPQAVHTGQPHPWDESRVDFNAQVQRLNTAQLLTCCE